LVSLEDEQGIPTSEEIEEEQYEEEQEDIEEEET